MFNDVKLQVDYECEMAFELLRLVKKQLKEVNAARPMSYHSKKAHSTVKRPIHKNTAFKNSNFNQRVNNVKDKNVNAVRPKVVVNVVKGNNVNAIKASACWVWKPKTKVLDHVNKQMDLQDQGVIDNGCSRHMIGNMSYLTYYEEIDGGYVAFGGNPKGGKITGRAKGKNRALIKAARIMLANYKLPTTFWAEAVNTACDVQNRVLVTKPHNKTHYELFLGRKPALSFMRPFGCLVTILNTIDYLGKFDGKANEGFFVGENTPNIARSGPNWLFDIDALTKSMNYEPVVARNQSNGNAGTKACHDSSPDAGFKPSRDDEKRINEVNTVGGKTSIKHLDDLNMPKFKDYSIFEDDEDVGAEANMNNLDTTIQEESKMVFKNKKDERGIMIRNKARLVSHGYTKEEGINYDEVFAPIARIEAIRLFLAYTSFKDFVVYIMDVKRAFLYGKIKEEVYVCQPPGFEDSDFLDRVYKVEKALYGLHQALRAWYKILSTYLLDNEFQRGKIDKNLFIKRYKDEFYGRTYILLGLQVQQKKDSIFISQDKYVGEILKKFRSEIGSLMYLTSSRPNIMFAVCTCARYQVTLKVSHLHVVKKIFRYLKGQLKLGLWYPKDYPFDLEAYTDSDYARASLDRKSTTRGKNYQWGSTFTSPSGWDKVIIIKASVRSDLYLDDEEGTDCLPNATIFEELTRMGFVQMFVNQQLDGLPSHKRLYDAPSYTKKIFGNIKRVGKGFSGRITPLFPTMVVQNKVEMGEASTIPTDPHHTPTFIQPTLPQRTQKPRRTKKKDTQATLNEPSSSGTSSGTGPRCQETMGDTITQTRSKNVSTPPNDPLLARGNTLRSGEGSMQLNELIELCTNLQQRVLALEKTKTTQAIEIGRIVDIDANKDIFFVNVHTNEDMFGVNDLDGDEVIVDNVDVVRTIEETRSVVEEVIVDTKETINVATTTTTTVIIDDEITFAKALAELKSAKPPTLTTTIAATTITTDSTRYKDRGKGKMVEPEPVKKMSKKDLLKLDEEHAFKLQAKEEEKERLAREKA
ncbi:retrovirus-related pol polyprotein from transposon TNT 1-94 [Tanacetum coccineum]